MFAKKSVCRAGRPAPRYRAAREPLPRVPTAFQGSKFVRRELRQRKYQVKARNQVRANAVLQVASSSSGQQAREQKRSAGRQLGGGDDDVDYEMSLRCCSLCVRVSGLFCLSVCLLCGSAPCVGRSLVVWGAPLCGAAPCGSVPCGSLPLVCSRRSTLHLLA